MKRILIIASGLLLLSCGSRKKEAYIETKIEEVKQWEKKEIVSNALILSNAEKTTYTPIDPTKEMILPDGRRAINTKIEEEKETKKEELSSNDKTSSASDVKKKDKARAKAMQSEKPNLYKWLFLSLGVVLIICFALYFSNRIVNPFKKK